VPAKPVAAMAASMPERMRSTSARPRAWISSGPSVVVVYWRTLQEYQASPSGSARMAIDSRADGM
jgi:hypothetical protein